MPGFDPVRDRALDAIIRLYRAGSLGGGGVSDGDYGDVVVTVGGTVWTLDAAVSAAFTPVSHVGSGGGAHANVVASGAAGFMTGADKAKLDSISGGLTSGTTTVNFGAFPGSTDASVDVTGQTGILAGSKVKAWIMATATADHTADEHLIDPPRVAVGPVGAGVGFTIYAFTTNTRRHYGAYTVAWEWS